MNSALQSFLAQESDLRLEVYYAPFGGPQTAREAAEALVKACPSIQLETWNVFDAAHEALLRERGILHFPTLRLYRAGTLMAQSMIVSWSERSLRQWLEQSLGPLLTSGQSVVSDRPGHLPKVLHFVIGGYTGPSDEVLWKQGQLLCRHAPAACLWEPHPRICQPSSQQWENFWVAVEAAGAWNWVPEYNDPRVLDGTCWSLELSHAGREVRSGGSNAFPGSSGPSYDSGMAFGQFLNALARLTGLRELGCHEPELANWQAVRRVPVTSSSDALESWFLNAIHAQRTVEFTYLGGSQIGSKRRVRPEALFRIEGFPTVYLAGFCETRQADRTFRLDRVIVPGVPSEPPTG